MKQEVRRRGKEKEGEEGCILLYLPLGEGLMSSFNMEKAVCNHGFFMMAPNQWDPSTMTLQRPLRLFDSTCINVRISHPPKDPSLHVLVLATQHSLSLQDQQLLLAQVTRMLRISDKEERKIREFQKIHQKAKKRGFGRLFRSPTLFEDMVKSILLCNCTWERSLTMARALCEIQLEEKSKLVQYSTSNSSFLGPKAEHTEKMLTRRELKRKQETCIEINSGKCSNARSYLLLPEEREFGDFPSSKELASLDENFLKEHCNLGYRASHILNLAKIVASGKFKPEDCENDEVDNEASYYKKVYNKLMKIEGFGSFTCANVLMCIGFYQRIPADTETIRHLRKLHGAKDCTKRTVSKDAEQIYKRYEPFQCLAYWFELLDFYEKKVGKLSKLPSSSYHIVSGSIDFSSARS